MSKFLADIGHLLITELRKEYVLLLDKKRRQKVVCFGILSVIFLNYAFAFLAFSLYNYLLSLFISPTLSALIGSGVFLVLTLLSFWAVSLAMHKKQPPPEENIVAGVILAFLSGLTGSDKIE